jgi:hypothetical protein
VHPPNNGHFTAVGAPGKLLVMIAYGVQESQIVGGPSWFAIEKWDIEAKCDDDKHSAEETSAMLRKLLEERFSLKMRPCARAACRERLRLQDQLGLRLAPERAPVDVIVVDLMERPSVN